VRKNRRNHLQGNSLLIPQEAVAFCASAELGPPLAGARRPGHDHQVSVEVLQDLDLGALGIPPQQSIPPMAAHL
jgi:hypothetical protein